jgi:hypothetical protein
MNVLITEEQSKIILVEGMSDILSTIYEKSTDFSANLYKRIAKRLKFNLKILLTFGAGVGGLMQPLMDMLDGKFNGLTEDQKLLIVVATICIVFNEGKEILKQVIPKIEEEGLEKEFRYSLLKTKRLVTVFKGFLGTLGNSAAFMTDVMSYIYLIPLLGYLTIALQGNSLTPDQIDSLVKTLAATGVLHMSTAALEEIVQRILKS